MRLFHRATKHKKACDLVIPYREGGGVEGWGSGSYVHSRFWTISYVHSVLGEHKETQGNWPIRAVVTTLMSSEA